MYLYPLKNIYYHFLSLFINITLLFGVHNCNLVDTFIVSEKYIQIQMQVVSGLLAQGSLYRLWWTFGIEPGPSQLNSPAMPKSDTTSLAMRVVAFNLGLPPSLHLSID